MHACDALTITITARAAAHMRRQLVDRGTPDAAVRVGLRGGGCTGYSYMLQFDDGEPRPEDHTVRVGDVVVYIDPKSMQLLNGATIDFETGIQGHGLKFNNPNVSGRCGCGESVSFR